MKKIIISLMFLFLLLSCSKNNGNIDLNTYILNENKIKVVTSIIPLASIVNYIGGDNVSVQNIIPAGVSPHGFDLKTEQAVSIVNSDLIVKIGLEHIDGFFDKILGKKIVLSVSDGINLLELDSDNTDGDQDDDSSSDPHIWVGTSNIKFIANKIKDELTVLKPEKKEYFLENYNDFVTSIDKEVDDFRSRINGKKINKFIVFHNAYNYLFLDLGINLNDFYVFMPNILTDMNSVEMKNLQDIVKTENIKVVFKEPQLIDKNLIKFATDYTLDVSVLDPLGTDEGKDGYIDNLRNNLLNLEKIYE
ncbi:MAG: metal ABC transporter substrate-binding protein [Candidatus Gracilibacteria bacterium]|nr:metal ABC transporter substrate-binding protein [Candidatus Gracilibacteria bacterium]